MVMVTKALLNRSLLVRCGPGRASRAAVVVNRSRLGVRAMASMAPRDLPGGKKPSEVSDSEWKTLLTDEQFRILRMKGTEYPGTGEYNKYYPKDGVFCCAGCHAPLYKSETKFDSGCGWPAFYDGLPGAVKEVPDADGMRIEIVCSNCGGHLGHVFKGEGFKTPTNARHCVNSVSIKYDK